jgi:hypothetical protein
MLRSLLQTAVTVNSVAGPTPKQWLEFRADMIVKSARAQAARPKRKKAMKMAKDAAVAHDQLLTPLIKQKARAHFSLENGIIHCDKLHKWPVAYDQDEAWNAFIDTLPKAPLRFLAMVAECERMRQIRANVQTKRNARRERYLRRHKQPATPEAKP